MMRTSQQHLLRSASQCSARNIGTFWLCTCARKVPQPSACALAHGEPNQRRANLAVTPERGVHREPRTEPEASALHRDGSAPCRPPAPACRQRSSLPPVAAHAASISSRSSPMKMPCSMQNTARRNLYASSASQSSVVHLIRNSLGAYGATASFAVRVPRLHRFTEHDHTSYDDSDEHAPHLPQPALISLERIAAALSIAPSGCRTDFMNSGVAPDDLRAACR